jgi:hypothetical protein
MRGCLMCGDTVSECPHSGYSARRVRFLLAHRESLEAAYLNASGAAASNELARLEREWRTLPPRHHCSCLRMNPRTGVTEHHCMECRRLAEAIPRQDIGAEFVGRRPPGSRVPSPAMLDLERAIEMIGNADDAGALARYMSYDGALTVQRPSDVVQVARAARHDAAPVATLSAPAAIEVVSCDCIGFRLGGAAYCAHQPRSTAA